jgi:hypothetical protein
MRILGPNDSGKGILVEWDAGYINPNDTRNTEVIKESISKTITSFIIEGRKMGDPLFLGDLFKQLGDVNGVVNVVDVRVFNLIGGEYSTAEVSQSYKDDVTKEILQSDMTIFMKANQIYQIRFPNKDIKVRVKTLGSTTY